MVFSNGMADWYISRTGAWSIAILFPEPKNPAGTRGARATEAGYVSKLNEKSIHAFSEFTFFCQGLGTFFRLHGRTHTTTADVRAGVSFVHAASLTLENSFASVINHCATPISWAFQVIGSMQWKKKPPRCEGCLVTFVKAAIVFQRHPCLLRIPGSTSRRAGIQRVFRRELHCLDHRQQGRKHTDK
jgi:hypothetical protein